MMFTRHLSVYVLTFFVAKFWESVVGSIQNIPKNIEFY